MSAVREFIRARIAEQRAYVMLGDPIFTRRILDTFEAVLDLDESWPVLVSTPPELEESAGSDGLVMRMSQQMAWLTTREYVKRFGTEPPTTPMLEAIAAIWREHADYETAIR